MFNVLDLLDSTIKEASKSNGRCSVKHQTVQNPDSITFISISRSLDEDFIPKTSLVLDQEELGKNTTVSLSYLDANNYLELNVFFEDDSCFKGITIYTDNGQPVHELASKIANSFIAYGKTAIFPLLERADIQAANKPKITHTTISSSDGAFTTQMSIAKGLTANDKRKMTVVLIQDHELGSTIFSIEFIEEADILCNVFLSNGTSYQGITIRDKDKEVCRTFAWKLINEFIEHGDAAFIDILPKQEEVKAKKVQVQTPAVNLNVTLDNNLPNKLSFKIDSKSAERFQDILCAKIATPKERETAMLELLLAIEEQRIRKDDSLISQIKEFNPKNSGYLFPEMQLEIPTSFEEPAFFTLYRADNFKLRFRLSGRKNIEARAKQLLDIIDAFKISPEKLAICHKSLLVDIVCPTSKKNIFYLANLYHYNRKLATQNSKVTLVYNNDLSINFTRYKRKGSALNLSICFINDELQISIKEKRYFFSHTRKFNLPTEFLDTQDNIDTLFVAFYNDKNGSIDKCGLKGSLIVYFLQSRSHLDEDSTTSDSSLALAS